MASTCTGKSTPSAALGAVSATNRANAEREVQRQLDVGVSVFSRLLESNRRQLTQAAQAVAADYGFREAVATRDTDTLVSVLENSGQRIGAAMGRSFCSVLTGRGLWNLCRRQDGG